MSERGSFVTEYVSCTKCFDAAKSILLHREKYLCSVVVPHWNAASEGPELPIIAGKVGGLYRGDELDTFEHDLALVLEAVLCHPMRIAVLAETGERIVTVTPRPTS